MLLPKPVQTALQLLEQNGFEAYVVGGCVRDLLLGLQPTDYDITTNALPEQTQQVFQQMRVIETGKKHGTITVWIDDMPLEITTYRIDGDYSDNRRPDAVRFTRNLEEDLARRDFTINAMAYHPTKGVVDYYHGQKDLKNHCIRCVGDPETRFAEDALRIMRGVRFCSTLGFQLEERTKQALYAKRGLLVHVSRERLRDELNKLLCGNNVKQVLLEYTDIIAEIIPEIIPCQNFGQHTKYHMYDVWEHTVHALASTKPDLTLRLTMLLHDLAKPLCFSVYDGVGHFYGHQGKSADLAEQILKRLHYSNDFSQLVVTLIRWHSAEFDGTARSVKKWLHKLGESTLRYLFQVQRADVMGKDPNYWYEAREIDQLEQLLEQIIREGQCFQIKQLAVNGNDMQQIGIQQGRMVGKTLEYLLDLVIQEKIPNQKQVLLDTAKEYLVSQTASNSEN